MDYIMNKQCSPNHFNKYIQTLFLSLVTVQERERKRKLGLKMEMLSVGIDGS